MPPEVQKTQKINPPVFITVILVLAAIMGSFQIYAGYLSEPDIEKSKALRQKALLEKAENFVSQEGYRLSVELGGLFEIQVSTFGDVNKDKIDDLIIITRENAGGTGFFRTLAVFLGNDPSLLPASSLFLGDRIGINSLYVRDGIISVDMIDHTSSDPACCPTLKII